MTKRLSPGFGPDPAKLASVAGSLAGDTKGCISNAQKAFESALKTLLGTDKGNASNLIRQFVADGHVDDLPTEFKTSFGEQVLMSVPTMGNRLGRHGQGAAVINVTMEMRLRRQAAHLGFRIVSGRGELIVPWESACRDQLDRLREARFTRLIVINPGLFKAG